MRHRYCIGIVLDYFFLIDITSSVSSVGRAFGCYTPCHLHIVDDIQEVPKGLRFEPVMERIFFNLRYEWYGWKSTKHNYRLQHDGKHECNNCTTIIHISLKQNLYSCFRRKFILLRRVVEISIATRIDRFTKETTSIYIHHDRTFKKLWFL